MTTYRDIDVTPLLYHNPLTPAPYHTIQQNGTIMYTAPNETSHDKIQKSCHAAFGCPNEYELQNLLRGCSSVNIFDDEIIVTTSAVPLPLNGTFALRIGLTRGAKVVGEALHVQLQSGAVGEQQQTSRFIPVKVEAFVLDNQREIQVNVIDHIQIFVYVDSVIRAPMAATKIIYNTQFCSAAALKRTSPDRHIPLPLLLLKNQQQRSSPHPYDSYHLFSLTEFCSRSQTNPHQTH